MLCAWQSWTSVSSEKWGVGCPDSSESLSSALCSQTPQNQSPTRKYFFLGEGGSGLACLTLSLFPLQLGGGPPGEWVPSVRQKAYQDWDQLPLPAGGDQGLLPCPEGLRHFLKSPQGLVAMRRCGQHQPTVRATCLISTWICWSLSK